jgi:hypothetical protein
MVVPGRFAARLRRRGVEVTTLSTAAYPTESSYRDSRLALGAYRYSRMAFREPSDAHTIMPPEKHFLSTYEYDDIIITTEVSASVGRSKSCNASSGRICSPFSPTTSPGLLPPGLSLPPSPASLFPPSLPPSLAGGQRRLLCRRRIAELRLRGYTFTVVGHCCLLFRVWGWGVDGWCLDLAV